MIVITMLVAPLVASLHIAFDTHQNMWLTWANKTGNMEFCLALTQVGNPFHTSYWNPILCTFGFQGICGKRGIIK